MSALICGSMAYDTIMVFHDKFKKHILPEQVHILNVSFMVPDMRKEFGGCAGNIAYNLHLLGGKAVLMATVGGDFGPYAQWLDDCGIDRQHIRQIDKTYTAQAFITTDLDDNQITAFHPGAMSFAHENKISDAQGIEIGILSPDGRDGMIEHAEQFVAAGIPFIFDPGQGMPMFDGADLMRFMDQANWMIVNDYEWEMTQERTGLSAQQVAERVDALIVTKGAEGAMIYSQGKSYAIPAVKAAAVKDPTGCGDAFRGGLLYGLLNGLDWETTGRIGALLGAIKVAHEGTQNHRFSREEFAAQFKDHFGYDLAL